MTRFSKPLLPPAEWGTTWSGAGDLNIYRSARNLIGQRGTQEAWRHAMQQGVEAESDLPRQAYWLRVADAVNDLALGFTKNGA